MTVDFIIIGAPKCGTSALAAYLAAHPQVCFSRPKEPHFFYRTPTVPCDATAVAEYVKRFYPHYDPERHKLCGEGTPRILGSAEALNGVLKVNPVVKLLVMVRDPAEMFFSWHQEMLRGLEEDESDPKLAWNLQEARERGEGIPSTCRDLRNLRYAEACSLGSQLEILYARVDAEQVHVIQQRDLLENPTETLRGVCDFLGLDFVEPREPLRVNVTAARRSDVAFWVYRQAFRLKCALWGAQPLPFDVGGWCRNRVFSSHPEDRPKPDAAFRRELDDYFESERRKMRGFLIHEILEQTP